MKKTLDTSITLAQFLSGLSPDYPIRRLIADLKPLGIKVVYESSVINDGVGRVLLSTQRFKANADFNYSLVQECGGVVVQYGDWKILSMPPYPCNPRCKLSTLNVEDYNIKQLNDGTSITLYWYNDEWTISTANGYSVGNLIWNGYKTYKKVLDECLKKYPEFNWDDLDPNKCYTIGFRHPEYHPFRPKKEVWFIQSVDLNTMNIQTDQDIGIPPQISVDVDSIDKLISSASESSTTYIKTRQNPNYGYILKHKTEVIGRFSNIMIESQLMKQIKNYVYNDNSGRLDPYSESYVGTENRLQYIALKAYLDYNNHYVFIQLFPECQKLYDTFDKFINTLVDMILSEKQEPAEYRKLVVDHLSPFLTKYHKIKLRGDIQKTIICDLIKIVDFADYFYDALYPQNGE